ncbi:hypothetical protein QTI50_14735 [Clostridium perfringens]|nr:hypothetical protein [Clostridium perfringens]
MAYECKENYPKFILNNLNNDINDKKIGEYKSGVFMIKHDTLIIK